MVIVKQESKSNGGFEPENRPISYLIKYGLVNLDKPSGPTSAQVVDWVKRIMHISKAGHSGTLDPRVTGVLPIAFESATKILHYLLKSGKEYVCEMRLHKNLPEEEVISAIKSFEGEIIQKPPVKSKVKRVERKRTVYELEILELKGQDALFRANVQSGTYIRKLCADVGEKLGTNAHMADLRRTRVGPFLENDSVTLQDLEEAWRLYKEDGDEKMLRKLILPVESAVNGFKKLWIVDSAIPNIVHGMMLPSKEVAMLDEGIEKDETIAIMSLKGELVSMAMALKSSEEILDDNLRLAAKSERVVMPEGIY